MTTSEIVAATAGEARALTDQIKVAVEGTWQLVQRAYQCRAWESLGYSSWDDYCTREFGTSRLRLPREERQEVVQSLREIGMSTRAIAAATGASVGTVHAEISSGVQNRTPDPDREDPEPEQPRLKLITGTDGKSYAAQPARTPNRPALPPQFGTVAGELFRLSSRVERLRGDDRYRANRTSIADECVPQIRRAVEVLTDLLDDLASEN